MPYISPYEIPDPELPGRIREHCPFCFAGFRTRLACRVHRLFRAHW